MGKSILGKGKMRKVDKPYKIGNGEHQNGRQGNGDVCPELRVAKDLPYPMLDDEKIGK